MLRSGCVKEREAWSLSVSTWTAAKIVWKWGSFTWCRMKKATTACHAVQDAGKISGYREEFLSIKDNICHFERLPLGALCVLIFLLLVRSPGGLEMDSPWARPFFSSLLVFPGLPCSSFVGTFGCLSSSAANSAVVTRGCHPSPAWWPSCEGVTAISIPVSSNVQRAMGGTRTEKLLWVFSQQLCAEDSPS